MNKKIVIILGFFLIPVGAILMNACGPVEDMTGQEELALNETSSNVVLPMYYGIPNLSQYGRCRAFWDTDGDGLAGPEDPDCHINAGPLRDLSLYDFPQGHNFFADAGKIPPGGPGTAGGFRNRMQMTRWFRFLTEPDGGVAGMTPYGAGVNPVVVPIAAPLAKKVNQGTLAEGNNNNLSVRGLTNYYGVDAAFMPGARGALAPAPGMNPAQAAALEVILPPIFRHVSNVTEREGLFYKGGSQGASSRRDLGNPDGEESHENVPPG